MDSLWIWVKPYVLSGLTGVLLTVLCEDMARALGRRTWRAGRRFAAGILRRRDIQKGQRFLMGTQELPWVVIDGGHGETYGSDCIECRYNPEPVQLPEDVWRIRQKVEEEQNERRRNGRAAAWNGGRYCLKSFAIERDPWEEKGRLRFLFGPSDYYNFLATSVHLDHPLPAASSSTTLRQRYLAGVGPLSQPVPFLAHSFGINLAVITRDNYLLCAQRSDMTFSRPGHWNVPVNEGLQRPQDNDATGAPDFFKAAARGLDEELGVQLGRDDAEWPRFLSFGLDVQLYQYGLLGYVRLNLRVGQVLEIRSQGVKDKWEAERLEAVPFKLDEVTRFIQARQPWAPAGLVCVIHTLIAEFGRASVRRALEKTGIRSVPPVASLELFYRH